MPRLYITRFFRLDQLAEYGSPRLERMLEPQHGLGDRQRLRTRQTHHADAAAPGRSSNGNDGVVEVQENFRFQISDLNPVRLFTFEI